MYYFQRAAADFTIAGGQAVTEQLLSANPKIDAIWNHDDDQGIGVLAAIDEAGRDEFFMVGGAGSLNAMNAIKSGDSVLVATVIYPSTQAADGIALARLLAGWTDARNDRNAGGSDSRRLRYRAGGAID